MSQENVEIVRRCLEAYANGEIERHARVCRSGGRASTLAIIGGAEAKVFRGHDGFRRWLAETRESFDELSTELTEYRDLGDRIVAFGHIHARGRGSGLEIDSPTGWVFTVRRGKVVRAEGFLSRSETLEAAGLSE